MKFKFFAIIFVFWSLASILLSGCGNDPEIMESENWSEILTEDNIYDLGGHIAAYLTDTTVLGYEGKWIVLNDLEKESCIYLSNEFSKILDIKIEDFSAIHLKYEDVGEGIQEINIPVCFAGRKDNVLEINYSVNKVIVESMASALMLPKTVWEETITYEENTYLIAFERISLAYYTGSDLYGKYADYQLVVKDEQGNIVSSQVIMGYPITQEEVYWLKNISEDDFPDVILCSSYVEGHADGFTELIFFIWNDEKSIYESKPLPWNKSISRPFWNEELSSITFAYTGDEINMKMFTFSGGEWQLNGELVEENETEKENGDIEVELGEYFYSDDQTIENDIRITLPEQNMPWNDRNSIWCVYNAESEWLFPGYEDWDAVEEELDDYQTVWKYVRDNSKEELII